MVTLSPQQQQVKEIVYDNGQSCRRAAEWLGIAFDTVRMHARLAKRKHAAAGEPLRDKRKHFITQTN